jgi:hypothetical protein
MVSPEALKGTMNPELSRIVIAQRTGQLQAEAEMHRLVRQARQARRARRARARRLWQEPPLMECIPTPNN